MVVYCLPYTMSTMSTVTLPTAPSTKKTVLVAFKHTSTYNTIYTMANDDDNIIQFGGSFDGSSGENTGNYDDIDALIDRANACVGVIDEFVIAGHMYKQGELACPMFPEMLKALVEATEVALYVSTEDLDPDGLTGPPDPSRN